MQIPCLFRYPQNFSKSKVREIAEDMKKKEAKNQVKFPKKNLLQYTLYEKQKPLGITDDEVRTLFKVLEVCSDNSTEELEIAQSLLIKYLMDEAIATVIHEKPQQMLPRQCIGELIEHGAALRCLSLIANLAVHAQMYERVSLLSEDEIRMINSLINMNI